MISTDTPHFRVQQLEGAIANAARYSRKSESKMAVAVPEVLISQLVLLDSDMISTVRSKFGSPATR